ncbi:MAG: porin [Neomegalonema sp.]|nr:porin [Neomegalonema sp.]
MKKVLFGSTALVAAAFAGAAAAGDVKLSVDGDIIVGVGVGAYKDGSTTRVEKDFHIIREGEIQFKAKGTLDNGITIEARMELEGYNATSYGSILDESWVAISGSFGKILIGNNDTALDAVAGGIGRLGSAVAMGSWDGSYEFVPASVDHAGDTGDGLAVHYYTPNIAGFQAGISWSPTNEEDAAIDTSVTTDNTKDVIAVGVSFSTTFDKVDFVIGGGFLTRTVSAAGAAVELTEDQWAIGAEVAFSGLTLGARYESVTTETGATTETEVTRFGGGIIYATGPWEFGLNAAFEDTDTGTASTSKEELRINAGVTYELGDGVDLGLGVDYGETETGTGVETDGIGGALLLGIAF